MTAKKKANMEDLSEHLDPLTADSSHLKPGQRSSYANPELSGWDHFQLKKNTYCFIPAPLLVTRPRIAHQACRQKRGLRTFSASKVMEMHLHWSSWMNGSSTLHSGHLTTSFFLCDFVTSFLWPATCPSATSVALTKSTADEAWACGMTDATMFMSTKVQKFHVLSCHWPSYGFIVKDLLH